MFKGRRVYFQPAHSNFTTSRPTDSPDIRNGAWGRPGQKAEENRAGND